MPTNPDSPRKPIPVSVVTYRVTKPDTKEVKRILGHELIEAERKTRKS